MTELGDLNIPTQAKTRPGWACVSWHFRSTAGSLTTDGLGKKCRTTTRRVIRITAYPKQAQ